MFELRRFGIKLELSTIKTILENLGNPQEKFKSIHVAGTNGKGSIASCISTILHMAGYKVGLYTSPHLIRFNERICINNNQISDEEVVDCFEAVKKANKADREPTFFEYNTAMAFYEFASRNVDWAVIETGMGGRFDATNIITPVISIISNISLEHQSYLGDTLTKIAMEKGGIIKPYVPIVTGAKQESVKKELKDIAIERNAPFYCFNENFKVKKNKDGTFDYNGIKNVWKKLRTGMLGNYQVDNTALVLALCELLKETGTNIPFESIKEGLEKNKWPGRLEVIRQNPFIILDGAHNLDGSKNLAKFLQKNLANKGITLVVGILDDKPYESMLKALLPVCKRVIITQAKNDRSLPTQKLYGIAVNLIKDITIEPDVDKALKYAIETVSNDEAICVSGSLYVIGEAKAYFGGIKNITPNA
ncbi:MAG: bifunctional folylpolyglutamate synthase/dihydrofolate synthase [Desulfobacterales bacterium]|nr:bifunctional folylpolyglutamate synthase/dihydrofolate synthase [Desulfobacterales bacterium]